MTLTITGGSLKGRGLKTIDSRLTRPTSSLARQALFNILGQDMTGKSFLDLFSGYGTVGIEAHSRGASQVNLVENNGKIFSVLKQNATSLGLKLETLYKQDSQVFSLQKIAEGVRFDVVFSDPPFGLRVEWQYEVLRELTGQGGQLIIQCSRRHNYSWLDKADLDKKYGESRLCFFYN